jgi:hypothetical protein
MLVFEKEKVTGDYQKSRRAMVYTQVYMSSWGGGTIPDQK